MKKFILKTSVFVIPFMSLYALNKMLYNQDQGDLVRLGYLYSNPSPSKKIKAKYSLPKYYKLLSEIDISTVKKFDVITIGDSFSEQDSLGYKNFLSKAGTSVLHIDRSISGKNPIQTLIQLMNSNLFDHVKTDYIVLQSIERSFLKRCQKLDFDMRINLDQLSKKNKKHRTSLQNIVNMPLNQNLEFFSDATLKIPLTNIQYCFTDKPKYSQTHMALTENANLFSNNPNEILFYQNDITSIKDKNDAEKCIAANQTITKINALLMKKNINLILLISPDKYDLYYQYLRNKEKYQKPLFFKFYDELIKEYHYVPSMKILSNELAVKKDIYYYDDTHWSPIGAEIIANEISKIIENAKNEKTQTVFSEKVDSVSK
jgi:hypothetical protein